MGKNSCTPEHSHVHTCPDGRQVSSTACTFFQHSPTLSQQHSSPHLSGTYSLSLNFYYTEQNGLSLQIFPGAWCLPPEVLAELAFAAFSTNMVPNRSSFTFAICMPKHHCIQCLMYSYATYQLWAGIQHHVLYNTTLCPWIPNHWLSHLWSIMHSNQMQISYNSWNITPSEFMTISS